MSARSSCLNHERWRNSTSGTSGSRSARTRESSAFASARLRRSEGGTGGGSRAAFRRARAARARRGTRANAALLLRLLVTRHRLRRLHVEDELGRRALRPTARYRRIREVVVGRVDLDRVEALRVVAQARGRSRDAARVPGLDEALVREAAARPIRTVAAMSWASGRPCSSTDPGRPTRSRYFFLTVLLWAVKPFIVGLTHGIGREQRRERVAQSGAAAPVAATARRPEERPDFARKL